VANVLGALALAVTDRTGHLLADRAALTPTSAAALSALHQFLDGPTVEELSRVLGLTHSGAVRLVDRLAAAGLVARGRGGDGRSRALTLTSEGERVAAQLAADRAGALVEMLDGLGADDLATLRALLGRVLANVVGTKDGGAWTCRFCDLAACGRDAGHCPAATAAAARYGPSRV
jgi:DNA-binding MarR family transcriptional regulator